MPWRSERRLGLAILAVWFAFALPLVPVLYKYREIHLQLELSRDPAEAEFFSADVAALTNATPLLRLWPSWLTVEEWEQYLYPGFVAVAVVALALWRSRCEPTRRWRRVRLTLAAAGTLFLVVGGSALVLGPWRIQIPGVTVSVTRVYRPVTVGLLGLFLAAIAGPRFGSAWRRRSPLAFYVCATSLMWLMCFGPVPRLLGAPLLYKPPYYWLQHLPGFDVLQVPARFAMPAALCLATAVGLGFASLTTRSGVCRKAIITALLAGAIITDRWIGQLPLFSAPPQLELPPGPTNAAVLELPLGDNNRDVAAMYRGMFHKRRVVNGYSGYFPREYILLRLGLELRDPGVLVALSSRSPLYIVVEHVTDPEGHWRDYASSVNGSRMLGVEQGRTVFLFGELPRAGWSFGGRLPFRSARASINGNRLAEIMDGDLTTRWDTGRPQRGDEEIVLDLDALSVVSRIEMSLGASFADFPRELTVDGSDDARSWRRVWKGQTAGLALRGAWDDPGRMPIAIEIEPVALRHIRLRQTGRGVETCWSIAELEIRGRPARQASRQSRSPEPLQALSEPLRSKP